MRELKLEEIQQILLDIMTDIDQFCRENNIRYIISSGTLLGAVRHKGFIPWDDDADMFMPREDFNRFVKIYKGRRYHLLYNTRNEKEFFASAYAKISDPGTANAAEKKSRCRYGVNVDIFPLDSVPEDPKLRQDYMHKVMRLHNRLYFRQKRFLGSNYLRTIPVFIHSLDWWWNKVDSLIRRGGFDDSPMVAHIVGTCNYRTVFPKSWLDNLKDIEFAGRSFMTLSDTDSYLRMVYGDYMTPPALKDRNGHRYRMFKLD